MSEKAKRPWSPSVANALEAREVLVELVTHADRQWMVIENLQNALLALATSRNDESMIAVCRSLGMEIANLLVVLVEADRRAKTGILVEEMDE